jgi:1-acyl-sn-glycerol-3-phosphate acyltransferase
MAMSQRELNLKVMGIPGLERLRAGSNLARTVGLIGMYVSSALLGKARLRDKNKRLAFFTRNIGTYTRRALKLINFDIKIVGYDAELMRKKRFLLVANHMSYLDIFILSSIHPCVFVTSVDMGETFFLGDIAELGGSIFIERRTRSKIERDIGAITEALNSGHHVVIYPEGTSTNGEQVLPFKKSLLMSAVRAGVDILPVVLKYTEIDGEPFNHKNRDRVCWYGDMSFLPHFLGLMNLRKVRAELHFLEPIKVTEELTRHDLADQAHHAIKAVYGNPLGIVQESYKNN